MESAKDDLIQRGMVNKLLVLYQMFGFVGSIRCCCRSRIAGCLEPVLASLAPYEQFVGEVYCQHYVLLVCVSWVCKWVVSEDTTTNIIHRTG